MNYTAKIESASLKDSSGLYELKIALIGSCQSEKPNSKLKGKSTTIDRAFSIIAPPPAAGDLVVLSKAESELVRKTILAGELPERPAVGEAIAQVGDFDSDSKKEVFLANSVLSLSVLPNRGGLIPKIATSKGAPVLDEFFQSGLRGTFEAGIGILSEGEFNPGKADFKAIRKSSGKRAKACMKAKIAGVAIKQTVALTADSQIIELDFEFVNDDKKAKKLDFSPQFKMHFLPLGEKHSGIRAIDSSGETHPYFLPESVPPWAWHEDWVPDYGDIAMGEASFVAVENLEAGGGLVFVFDRKSVSRIWAQSLAILPNLRLFGKKLTMKKGDSAKIGLKIVALDGLAVSKGTLLGWTACEDGLLVSVIGRHPEKLVANVAGASFGVALKSFSDEIAVAKLAKDVSSIEIPESGLKIEVKNV